MESSSADANIHGAYENLMLQYKVLNHLTKSDQLNVNNSGDLVVVSPQSSIMGRIYQAVVGSTAMSGNDSPWEAVAQNIEKLLDRTKEILPLQKSLLPSELNELKGAILIASDSLEKIAKERYPGEVEAQNKFLELAESINQLSKQIIAPDYEESFFILEESEKEPDVQKAEQQIPEEEWYLMSLRGPLVDPSTIDSKRGEEQNWRKEPNVEGMLGKLGRVLQTTTLWCLSTRTENPGGVVFPAAWEQLTSPIVESFIKILQEKVSFIALHQFYTNRGINEMTLDQIKRSIDSTIGGALDQPVAIPLLLTGKESLSRDHIVAILIKDGCIEYFDSMGVGSKEQKLAEGSGTLRDVLEYCKDRYGLTSIQENEIQLQKDIHSCGTFVCEFFIRRLESNDLMGSSPKEISSNELLEVRERIASEVLPALQKEIESRRVEQKKPSMTSMEDDFEID